MGWLYGFSKRAMWLWCKIWHRASAEGVENVPKVGAVVLASNHASHLDPVIKGIFLPRPCRYVARHTLGRIPLVGRWMAGVGVVFIDRQAPSRETMLKVVELLGEGECIGMFPEGTRSRDGRVHSFQRGLLLLLKKSGADVVPVGIRGSFSAFPPGARWPRPRKVSVHYGAPMSADEVLAEGGLEALRAEVARLAGTETS